MADPADRHALVRSVASVVAHELNGTLQALFTYASLAESAPQAGHVARVRECAQRLHRQLTTLREFAHTDGPGAPLELGDRVAIALAAEADGARTILALPPGPHRVVAGERALSLALAALVRGVRRAADAPAELRARLEPVGPRVRLVLEEGQPCVEPSTRVEPSAGGSIGMDLWLAALLFGELGGELAIAGLPGARRLEVDLPCADPPGAAP